MVRFRKNSFLFFAVLVFFLNSSFSQNLFKSGYIIDLKGDTIFGEIDYRGDKYMGHKCRFVKDGIGKQNRCKNNGVSRCRQTKKAIY